MYLEARNITIMPGESIWNSIMRSKRPRTDYGLKWKAASEGKLGSEVSNSEPKR